MTRYEIIRQAIKELQGQVSIGDMPNACYVHRSALKEKLQVGPVEVVPLATVLKYHFWIGKET